MSTKMIIILGIVVGLLLLYLIRKAIHEYKEKKKIERWKSIWTSKRYSEFFKKVPSKNDLNRVVSTQNFLTAGFSMSVDIFLSALVQYGFIECSRQSSFQMRYSYPTLYPQKLLSVVLPMFLRFWINFCFDLWNRVFQKMCCSFSLLCTH